MTVLTLIGALKSKSSAAACSVVSDSSNVISSTTIILGDASNSIGIAFNILFKN